MPKDQNQPEHKVVAEFRSSPIIYGFDSRERRDNPDWHPPILLTSTGKFINQANRVLSLDEVPDYVKAAAKKASLGTDYKAPGKVEMTLAEAMNQATAEAAPQPVKRGRGRPKKAA